MAAALSSDFPDLDFFLLPASESESEVEVEDDEEMNELSLKLLLLVLELELESESELDPRRFFEDERFFFRSPMATRASLSLSESESLPAVRDLDRRYEQY